MGPAPNDATRVLSASWGSASLPPAGSSASLRPRLWRSHPASPRACSPRASRSPTTQPPKGGNTVPQSAGACRPPARPFGPRTRPPCGNLRFPPLRHAGRHPLPFRLSNEGGLGIKGSNERDRGRYPARGGTYSSGARVVALWRGSGVVAAGALSWGQRYDRTCSTTQATT